MNQPYTSTINSLRKDVRIKRPHVVILGAGATLAAFPYGDSQGKKLPLMNNIVDVVRLRDILNEHKISWNITDNFENIFSNLSSNSQHVNLVKKLEKLIYNYFSILTLPSHPTLYDHLILSLRKKDVIATFNWDPLLVQAASRIRSTITENIPKLFFLHGNVGIYFDEENMCKRIRLLDSKAEPSKLLYPVAKKDYHNDTFIKAEWLAIQNNLKKGSMLTIFGYSAPTTDVEAKKLLQVGWGNSDDRSDEDIEIIDIKSEDEIFNTWESFICSHHYQIYNSFYDSFISKYPRRSCEASFRQNFECEYLDDGVKHDNIIKPWKFDNFDELKEWFLPLIVEE